MRMSSHVAQSCVRRLAGMQCAAGAIVSLDCRSPSSLPLMPSARRCYRPMSSIERSRRGESTSRGRRRCRGGSALTHEEAHDSAFARTQCRGRQCTLSIIAVHRYERSVEALSARHTSSRMCALLSRRAHACLPSPLVECLHCVRAPLRVHQCSFVGGALSLSLSRALGWSHCECVRFVPAPSSPPMTFPRSGAAATGCTCANTHASANRKVNTCTFVVEAASIFGEAEEGQRRRRAETATRVEDVTAGRREGGSVSSQRAPPAGASSECTSQHACAPDTSGRCAPSPTRSRRTERVILNASHRRRTMLQI
jgi:hypothetical protein